MPAGRPSKYGPKLLDNAREYLDTYKELEQVFPSIAGLAVHLGLSRETVHAWCKDTEKKEFSDICKDLMANQEIVLANGGLSGSFNSTITKLMLTKHGLSDKQEVSGPDGGPIEMDTQWQVEFVNPEEIGK